ncbi:MAG: FAD-dependent oxidoreductase [Desulfovibrio sp.]|nr:FAD-dependent oxidoreductase [Desulfovibrio sp.]
MSKADTAALIIGGGIAGLETALKLGQGGYTVILAEKESALGGNVAKLHSSFPRWEDPQELIKVKQAELKTLPSVRVLANTEITGLQRQSGGFTAHWTDRATQKSGSLPVQALIFATGFELFNASVYGEYGYGIYKNVVNSLEFEHLLGMYEQRAIHVPESIAFFKCVGSRDRSKGFPYCSKICCMYTAKQAGLVKKISPDTQCYVFYMDYRASGKEYEEFVRQVIEERKVRYVRGRPSKVVLENDKLLVRFEDTLIGVPMEASVDLIVLASAVVPRPETLALARMLGLKTDDYGFVEPVYGSPVRIEERIFMAGGCGFAIESLGAIAQGAAAAAEVTALFNKSE